MSKQLTTKSGIPQIGRPPRSDRPLEPPNELRSLRLKQNLSLNEVARRLGVTPSALSRTEWGERRLGADYMRRLAEMYGVDGDRLILSIFFPKKSTLE